jgi:sugar phosphate isomerase/epimerase
VTQTDTIFAVRQDVDLDDIPGSLPPTQTVPLELALPWRVDEFLSTMDRLSGLKNHIQTSGLSVVTVHAPQGRLTDDMFRSWALPTMAFAESVGARVVTFHPENCAKLEKPNLQRIAVANIKQLQRQFDPRVSIESFGNPKRVMSPEDIVGLGLPLTLDVSHLESARTLSIIGAHWRQIRVVHLSEYGWHEGHEKNRTHTPAGKTCEEVLRILKAKGWQGVITLEYLEEFRSVMFADRERLEKDWRRAM